MDKFDWGSIKSLTPLDQCVEVRHAIRSGTLSITDPRFHPFVKEHESFLIHDAVHNGHQVEKEYQRKYGILTKRNQ